MIADTLPKLVHDTVYVASQITINGDGLANKIVTGIANIPVPWYKQAWFAPAVGFTGVLLGFIFTFLLELRRRRLDQKDRALSTLRECNNNVIALKAILVQLARDTWSYSLYMFLYRTKGDHARERDSESKFQDFKTKFNEKKHELEKSISRFRSEVGIRPRFEQIIESLSHTPVDHYEVLYQADPDFYNDQGDENEWYKKNQLGTGTMENTYSKNLDSVIDYISASVNAFENSCKKRPTKLKNVQIEKLMRL